MDNNTLAIVIAIGLSAVGVIVAIAIAIYANSKQGSRHDADIAALRARVQRQIRQPQNRTPHRNPRPRIPHRKPHQPRRTSPNRRTAHRPQPRRRPRRLALPPCPLPPFPLKDQTNPYTLPPSWRPAPNGPQHRPAKPHDHHHRRRRRRHRHHRSPSSDSPAVIVARSSPTSETEFKPTRRSTISTRNLRAEHRRRNPRKHPTHGQSPS